MDRTYTYAEVADLMRVTKQTVYNWVKTGMLPSPTYIGASARFPADVVANLINNGLKPMGFYTPTESIRAEIGRQGQAALAASKRAKKRRQHGRRKGK